MSYNVIQIDSRQYKIEPGQIFEIDRLPDGTKGLIIDKVLLKVEEKKVSIGKPYLEEKIELEVLENIKKDKIRTCKYRR